MPENKIPFISRYDMACFQLVKEIIEASPEQGHSLAQLTRKAGISRTKLTYGFKKVFGQTIHQYLISIRMERAKSMLVETDKPIKAIAKLNGYKDVKNFLTAFKKYTGQTPVQYQKK